MAIKLHSGQEMLYKNQSKGNNLKTKQGRVTVLVHCTLSHCQKHTYQVYSHLNLWWQSYAPDKEIWTPPPTKVIPLCRLVVRLHSGQEMLYKNQSKGNHLKTKQGRVTVLLQCTLSHCQKHAYQVWSHLDLRWQSYAPDKEIQTPPPTKVISLCRLVVRWHKN